MPRENWNHVPTKDNPADLASRETTVQQLVDSQLWWTGPSWLAQESDTWPDLKPVQVDPPEKRELKVKDALAAFTIAIQTQLEIVPIEKYSSLRKIIRIMCYVLQFVKGLRKSIDETALGPKNRRLAKFHLVRIEQLKYLSEVYLTLSDNEELDKASNLRNLSPFMDKEFNILRVGGRLGQSSYSESKKCPVIVPKESKLVHLIIAQYHEVTLHGGGN